MDSSIGRVASTPTLYEERRVGREGAFEVPSHRLLAMWHEMSDALSELTFSRRLRNEI